MNRQWVHTVFSKMLSGRRAKDTTPERTLRKALFSRGLRYRLHRPIVGRTTADIVFPGARLAVFVDGCFWHGCPHHGRSRFTGPNAQLWRLKLRRNRLRDSRITRILKMQGWRVLRFWECSISTSPATAANKVLRCVQAAAATRTRQRESRHGGDEPPRL
jgi:DNA mismatch endonuclease, patch repair protein